MSRQASGRGNLAFQHCTACDAAIYPPRESCPNCLSDDIEWRPSEGAGSVLAQTVLARSFDPAFGHNAHIPLVSVKLDDGPVAIAFAEDEALVAGTRVRLAIDAERPLGPAFVAHAQGGKAQA